VQGIVDKKIFTPLFSRQCGLSQAEFHFSFFIHHYGEIPSVYTHFLDHAVGDEQTQKKDLREWCKAQGLTLVAQGSYSGVNEVQKPPWVDDEDYLSLEWSEELHGEIWRSESEPLLFSTDFKQAVIYFRLGSGEHLVKSLIEKFPARKKKVTKAQINFLVHDNGFRLRQVYLPEAQLDLATNYGKAFPAIDARIQAHLCEDKPGLVLLHGDPGTGKSYYIRYLLSILREAKRQVIYVPPFVAKSICQPEFLPFMLNQNNPILVVEDAEQILVSRETEADSAVTNVLNLTDGILAEAIRCQVLATFNVSKVKIDPALLRKGRLKIGHHFLPLSPEEANAKLKELGIEETVTEPTTLADLYNFRADTGHTNNRSPQAGFAQLR